METISEIEFVGILFFFLKSNTQSAVEIRLDDHSKIEIPNFRFIFYDYTGFREILYTYFKESENRLSKTQSDLYHPASRMTFIT